MKYFVGNFELEEKNYLLNKYNYDKAINDFFLSEGSSERLKSLNSIAEKYKYSIDLVDEYRKYKSMVNTDVREVKFLSMEMKEFVDEINIDMVNLVLKMKLKMNNYELNKKNELLVDKVLIIKLENDFFLKDTDIVELLFENGERVVIKKFN